LNKPGAKLARCAFANAIGITSFAGNTPTPTPVATWFVPPSPTPRVTRSVETPIGSSNLDFIMQQGTLVIGWVGPALFAILFGLIRRPLDKPIFGAILLLVV